MTREQAINSMISHGFTVEQAGEIIKAVTPQFSSGLDKNSKKLEKGTTKNNLGVDCINKADFVKKLESETIGFQSWQKALIYQVMDDCHSVTPQEPRKGEWLRMSDLSEQEDDRYKCSRCGNVVHHKNKMDLYTFNSWCGRCGSDNGRYINYEVEE